MVLLANKYNEDNAVDKFAVAKHITGDKLLPLYDGKIEIKNGQLTTPVTLLHSRSFADDVLFKQGKELFSGELTVKNGKISLPIIKSHPITVQGKSLLHSAPLSTEAFKKGFFGDWGQYIIPLSLLMFAFSTAIAWSYYGDRAVTYLWGSKYVRVYHVIYVIGFFFASFTDTTIIWIFSGVSIALMTLPNLLGILLLHKEVKTSVDEYWKKHKK